MKLEFGQFFLLMIIWILVEILKLGLANIFKFNFSRNVWDFEVDTCSRFWRWNLIKICVQLVIWTQPSGPLCLWQCFIIRSRFQQHCCSFLYFSSSSLLYVQVKAAFQRFDRNGDDRLNYREFCHMIHMRWQKIWWIFKV